MLVLVAATVLAAGGLYLVGWVADIASSAPNISELKPRDQGQLSEVFAADGTLLGYIRSDILRTPVPERSLPSVVTRATVAIEDRRFYQHGGVDYQGILRAGVKDVLRRRSQHPGRLDADHAARPQHLPAPPARRYAVVEAQDHRGQARRGARGQAHQALDPHPVPERRATTGRSAVKTAVGVGAASQLFFDKPVGRSTLPRRRCWPGCRRRLLEYNPFLDPRLARGRRHEVLDAMVQSGYITQAQANAADHSTLQIKHNDTYSQNRRALRVRLRPPGADPEVRAGDSEKGGLKVYTTIDLHARRRRDRRSSPTRASPGIQPQRSSASTRSNGTSSPWPPRRVTTRRTSTTRPSRTGRRGLRSRCSC